MQTVNQVEDGMISKRHKVSYYKFELFFKQYRFILIFLNIFKITEKDHYQNPVVPRDFPKCIKLNW